MGTTRTARVRTLAVASLAAIATLVAVAPPAAAATFAVNSTGDTADANPGNGVCADAGGDCTLRAAVEEANALAGADTITVPGGTYAVASELTVTSSLTIDGAGLASTRLQAVGSHYLAEVLQPNVAVTFSDMTIGRGDHLLDGYGIAVKRDGVGLTTRRVLFDGVNDTPVIVCCGTSGDPDDTTVTVVDTTFFESDYSVLVAGGSGSELHISGSTFEGNYYGILFDGSAGPAQMTLVDSTIVGNHGPGIELYAEGATLRVHDSQILDSIDTFGEGIFGSFETEKQTIEVLRSDISGHLLQGMIVEGDVTIRDSTLNGNGRDALDHTGGTLLIEDSTFSGNDGYGIGAYGGGAPSATIRNTTVAGNTVDGGYAMYVGNYSQATIENVTVTGSDIGFGSGAGSTTIRNTIIAGAATSACDQVYPSAGGNLTDDPSCGFAAARDVVATPKLGALANNGGPTQTRLPAADSPAVDGGVADGCPTTDQRGVGRPIDGDGDATAVCDVGAVERGGTADLSLGISATPSRLPVGSLVTLDLPVSSNGPDAVSATVTVVLPTGLAFSAGSSGCTADEQTVTCPIASVAPGGTTTVQVIAAAVAPGPAPVKATVEAGGVDPDPDDDDASTTVTVDPAAGVTQRLFGLDRIETAVAASQDTYADGTAGAVVLARDDNFPDALAGAPLAVENQAPLLLTPTVSLDERTAAELQRVLPAGGTVHLLGGTSALSDEVQGAVEGLGYTVVRYGGADRYATAILIAEALGTPKAIFVATGVNFPDALSAGAAAAEIDGVIVLTAGDAMAPPTAAYLRTQPDVPRWAIGGPSSAADPGATPLVGSDRYATALLVARTFFENPGVVGVAVGTRFPDALAGDTHISRRRAPMLLVEQGALPPSVAAYLGDHRSSIQQVFVYGGPGAVGEEVEAAIVAALS